MGRRDGVERARSCLSAARLRSSRSNLVEDDAVLRELALQIADGGVLAGIAPLLLEHAGAGA
jgi:hypothetical protein